MKENQEIKDQNKAGADKRDCGCGDDCCPPKKKSTWPKIIFSLVIVAALGIIIAKLFFSPPTAPASNSQVFNDPNKPVWADTSCSKSGCDTTKGSSCCPK